MAKSKNGGTRAMIRGRVGSDVYSIGKDGKGARQQVVRSLAEQVANPRTQAQMFNRMIMSTVMQAVSAMTNIIDHSFDGLAKGQPSISEFIRANYNLVKQDALSHPDGGNGFGLNIYQDKGVKVGNYQVSDGKVSLPACVSIAANVMTLDLSDVDLTVGGLKSALGLSADGYLTMIVLKQSSQFLYARVHVSTELADETAISAANVESLFALEGNVNPTIALSGTSITFTAGATPDECASGVIVSEMINGAWKHNKCILAGAIDIDYKSEVALPSYPVGAENFLNGGGVVATPSSEQGGGGGGEVITVAKPTISGNSPFVDSTQVTITAENGAQIYYTTSGDAPSSASTLYSGPFTISLLTTIKAIAIKSGVTSEVATKYFQKGEE
ncbi:MAG: chitobiase/beta-hexosaminidase C-terminal domain-containing protein [Bacteroidaceae bacterium]|nr:chitobiase/beta-hexosaminidase C-terminal domain-containing protein [Bacteroidaceae bacterium]